MRFRRRLALLTCLTLTVAPAAGPNGIDAAAAAAPTVTIASPSTAWTRRVEWGLERFRLAGLRLPPLAIIVHRDGDKEPCGGSSGRYRADGEVHLCSSSEPGSRTARLITLHELAHAWAETELGAGRKEAFLRLRGLDTWVDPAVQPHEWGAEHAAEVVSWGLMDEPAVIIRIHDAAPDQLAVAFDLLAEQPPLWIGRASERRAP